MNRFSIIGQLLEVSDIRNVGPKKTAVITCKFKTDDSVLKITFWGKKAYVIDSKKYNDLVKTTPGLCFSVVGWLNINSWEYQDKIYAELVGTADNFLPVGMNLKLFSHFEAIGEIVKSYGQYNYMFKPYLTIKGKKSASEFIPILCYDCLECGDKIHIIGSIVSDRFELNRTRQTIDVTNSVNFSCEVYERS